MSAPDITDEEINKFRQSNFHNHLTILLGAGASTDSGLPSWNQLSERLLVNSGVVRDQATAAKLVAHQDPLIIADGVRQNVGDREWATTVHGALYGTDDGRLREEDRPAPSILHRAAATCALDGVGVEPARVSLMTLNFDMLLEEAINSSRRSSGGQVWSLEAKERVEVYHLHGTVPFDEPESVQNLVLTLTDVNDLIARGEPEGEQLSRIKRAVRLGPLVVAGTSYSDPDLRYWVYRAFQSVDDAENPPAGFVVLARQAFGVSKSEFESMRKALTSQWQEVGLTPLLVHDFSDAAQLLVELKYVMKEGYKAPRTRVQLLYREHVESFNELQERYQQTLALDRVRIAEALGVDQLDISLWIADGEEIVRWAVCDRVYRRQDNLRSGPTGHDSHFVAGRALAIDDITLYDVKEDKSGLDQGRWSTVIAVPVALPSSHLAPVTTVAVLTIGLAQSIQETFLRDDNELKKWIILYALSADWGRKLNEAVRENNES